MQIPGTLFHPCQFRAGCVPTQTSPFHSFLDFSDKDFMPRQWAATELCRMGPPTAKLGLSPGCATREDVASGGQLPSQPPCQHQGGHSVSCATPGDTLCIALSNGVRGWNTHKAENSLSEEPLGLVLLPCLYQNDLHGRGHT